MGNVFLFMFWCAIYILGGSWLYGFFIEMAYRMQDDHIIESIQNGKGWVILLWPIWFIYSMYIYFTYNEEP